MNKRADTMKPTPQQLAIDSKKWIFFSIGDWWYADNKPVKSLDAMTDEPAYKLDGHTQYYGKIPGFMLDTSGLEGMPWHMLCFGPAERE